MGMRSEGGGEPQGIADYLDQELPEANEQAQGVDDNSEGDQTTDTTESVEGESDLDKQLAGVESSEEGNDLLSKLNDMGVLKDGIPHTFENEDQIKELLKNGLSTESENQQRKEAFEVQDQEMATKIEEFESSKTEFEEYKQEVNNELVYGQAFNVVLTNIQQNDPELFREIQASFQQALTQFGDKINDPSKASSDAKMKSYVDEKFSKLEDGKVDEEAKNITKDWDDKIAAVQKQYGPKLRTLKVLPKYQEARKLWLENKGKLTPKQAFIAIHEDLITKALGSKRTGPVVKNNAGQPGAQTKSESQEGESLFDVLDREAKSKGF